MNWLHDAPHQLHSAPVPARASHRVPLPDDLELRIKQVAQEHSRIAYARRRDELKRRVREALADGDDPHALLNEELRAALIPTAQYARGPARETST